MMTRRQIFIHSFFLGLCAAFLSALTEPNSAIPFTLFSTTSIYIFLRRNLASSKALLSLSTISLLLMIIAFGAGLALSKEQITTVIIAGIILMLYIIPSKWALRNHPLLKPLSIALCWSLMTVGVAFDNSLFFLPNDHSVFEIFLQIFFLTFFLSLLYDYRDAIFIKNQESTLPKIFSEKKFYSAIWIALVSSFVGFILFGENSSASIAYFTASTYTLFLFKKIKTFSYARATWLTDVGFIVYGLTYFGLNKFLF